MIYSSSGLADECGIDMATQSRAGRPAKIQAQTLDVLLELIEQCPSASIQELADKLEQRTGIRVCRETMQQTLLRQGIERVRPGPDAAKAKSPRDRGTVLSPYGYNDTHRPIEGFRDYPSSVTDAEWKLVEELFNTQGPGAPSQYARRHMLDAICYVVRSGCSWRMLPKEFPPWQSVYATFRRWARQGLFESMHDRLRAQWREREQRAIAPTASIIDSQSVRTSERGGPSGFDAAKKVKGRKRHLVTDTLGLLLAVVVLSGDIQDREGAEPLLSRTLEKYPTVEKTWADSAYAGRCATTLRERFGLDVEIVRHARHGVLASSAKAQLALPGFERPFSILPRRWVIERTNAWSNRPRRMARDYDQLPHVSEAWIWLTHARLLVRRLAHG